MPPIDGPSGRANDPQIAADDVVDLEPMAAGGDDAGWLDVRDEVVASAMLRWRLTVVAGFLALFHLAFAAIKLTGPAAGTGFTSDVPAWSLLVRASVALAAVALLRSATPLGMRRLRWVEWALLLVEMSFILAMQYLSVVELIDRRDLIDAVAVQKNGVIRTLVLMICFGVLLPRLPASTARISVTMAAMIIFCHAVVLHHADTVGLDVDDVAGHQIVMANALFLIMGVVLATLAAWVLRDREPPGRPGGLGRVGPYRLLRHLDTGGTGQVYAAQHDDLGRPCAIKCVRPGDDEASARFEREVQAAARLSHPNTVTVFDCGRTGDGTAYCAMEFLPGLCLADVVRRSGPLPAGRVVFLGRQICGALAEAHRLGFVHGDLSPANVFVAVLGGRCDVVKVLDFGAVGGAALPERHPDTAATVAGTPEYAAPEQVVVGGRVDGRADVYGLGTLLYFMITGGPPFVRATPAEVLRAQVSAAVTPPREREPTVPADLEAVILRCLAKRPEDRYPDARAVAAALGACGCSGEWNEDRAEAWWLKQSSA